MSTLRAPIIPILNNLYCSKIDNSFIGILVIGQCFIDSLYKTNAHAYRYKILTIDEKY